MNLLKSALKTFKKFKLFTFINSFGLALGISSSLVILLYVFFEQSFDKFHADADKIFRVNEIYTSPESKDNSSTLRAPYGPALKEEIAEIDAFVRVLPKWHPDKFVFNNKSIAINHAIYADTNFFNFFTFPLQHGSKAEVLTNKNSIVLTDEFAKKLFGNVNPIGQTIKSEGKPFVVTGVAQNVPLNSHITFEAVLPMQPLLDDPDVYTGWDGGISMATFVKLNQSETVHQVNAKLPDFLYPKINKKNEGSGHFSEMYLENLLDVHLKSGVDYDNFGKKDAKTIYILLLIGILVFVVAVLNYIFISTGILNYRYKEFSIKKYLGFQKQQVFKQFQLESFLIFFIAISMGLLLIKLFSVEIEKLFDSQFISFQLKRNAFVVLGLFLLTSVLCGSTLFYFYLRNASRQSLTSASQKQFRSKRLILVSAFQFCITIILVVSILQINSQLKFMLSKDLGFKSENIINITHGGISAKKEALLSELSKIPEVENVSTSYGIPGLETTANGYKPEGQDEYYIYSAMHVDDNFFSTFDIKLTKGRDFMKGDNSDTEVFIINETLARKLKWENPIGKHIERNGQHEIIGVVKDFHVGLLYSEIPPLIISKQWQDDFYSLSIAINSAHIRSTIDKIEQAWIKVMPGSAFNFSFFDERFEQLYTDVNRTIKILSIFTVLSLLISVLGIFGITILLVNAKVKEIGIRKVNGARVSELLKMLNKDFVLSILIAFIVACPLAFYAMRNWLNFFAYKTQINIWLFILAGVTALLIAMLTISWQTLKAARRNPVEALRYE